MKRERGLVLYLAGGMMSGVFGAGIATRLCDENFLPQIKEIDCDSAGGCNAGYMVARQPRLGSSIYLEDLLHGFISPRNIPGAIRKRFQHRFISEVSKDEMVNVVDINMLMNVFEYEKPLDVGKIAESQIPVLLKVFDVQKGETIYKDLRENPLGILREGISVAPYYFDPNLGFIDAGFERIGFDELRARHRGSKIAVCLNYNPDKSKSKKLIHLAEGVVASWMFPEKDMYNRLAGRNEYTYREIEKVRKDENALLICPPSSSQTTTTTTNPDKLIETWRMGYKEAERILEWVG